MFFIFKLLVLIAVMLFTVSDNIEMSYNIVFQHGLVNVTIALILFAICRTDTIIKDFKKYLMIGMASFSIYKCASHLIVAPPLDIVPIPLQILLTHTITSIIISLIIFIISLVSTNTIIEKYVVIELMLALSNFIIMYLIYKYQLFMILCFLSNIFLSFKFSIFILL